MAQISGSGPPQVMGAASAAASTAAQTRRRGRAFLRAGETQAAWTPYLFLAVPLLLYTIWVLGPMVYSFYMSLTDTDGLTFSE